MVMMRSRIVLVLFGFTLAIALAIGRLLWIQLLATHPFSAKGMNLLSHSVRQRELSLVLNDGRARIMDRYLLPLTGESYDTLAIFPLHVEPSVEEWQINAITEVLQIEPQQWRSYIEQLKHPEFYCMPGHIHPIRLTTKQALEIRNMEFPGVRVVPFEQRYGGDYLAQHLIGFIGEHPSRVKELYSRRLAQGKISEQTKIGASGLEKSFDSLMLGPRKSSIAMYVDPFHRPLQGLNLRRSNEPNPYYPLQLITTLDRQLQQDVERIIDRMPLQKGSVIILNAADADVLAMASRPAFNPYQIQVEQGNWRNRGLEQLPPGSIFKIVMTVAALEERIVKPQERFKCNGEYGKYGLSCWKQGGHGNITLEEAFAQSCNVVFAQLAERLSADQIDQYAHELGLGRQVGWQAESQRLAQFDYEHAGQIFANTIDRSDQGILAQTAIGQRDVRMTPLQGANLMVTLLNRGEIFAPRIVQEIRYANHHTKHKFPVQTISKNRHWSEATMRFMTKAMDQVVREGTGRTMQQAKWPVAGKTGTAQVHLQGGAKIHQWFVGYAPSQLPKYAIAVVAEELPSGHASIALELTRRIVDLLATREQSVSESLR